MTDSYDICCGIDVGKASHHITAINKHTGRIIINKPVDQSEDALREVLKEASSFGKVFVVVDQPGSLAALVLSVVEDLGIKAGFITPRAMAQALDLYGGDLKNDARDAFVIADVSMRIPELVNKMPYRVPALSELKVLLDHDRNLTNDIVRTSNRLHDLLLSIHPALERALSGKNVQTKLVLLLLEHYGGPLGLRRAGKQRVSRWVAAQKGYGASAVKKVSHIFDALEEQSVSLVAAPYIEDLIRYDAKNLSNAVKGRITIALRRNELLKGFPEAEILLTLSGVGPITAATFLVEVKDISRFTSAAALASYAGLAPKVRQSGKTINSSSKPRGGNRRLKRVLVLSAESSVRSCPASKDYYQRKRKQGRTHRSALIALARKRLNVMYAMLRDQKGYIKENG